MKFTQRGTEKETGRDSTGGDDEKRKGEYGRRGIDSSLRLILLDHLSLTEPSVRWNWRNRSPKIRYFDPFTVGLES